MFDTVDTKEVHRGKRVVLSPLCVISKPLQFELHVSPVRYIYVPVALQPRTYYGHGARIHSTSLNAFTVVIYNIFMG